MHFSFENVAEQLPLLGLARLYFLPVCSSVYKVREGKFGPHVASKLIGPQLALTGHWKRRRDTRRSCEQVSEHSVPLCTEESESCLYYPVPARCSASDSLTHCSTRLPAPGCPAWSRPCERTDPGRGRKRNRIPFHFIYSLLTGIPLITSSAPRITRRDRILTVVSSAAVLKLRMHNLSLQACPVVTRLEMSECSISAFEPTWTKTPNELRETDTEC